MGHLAARRYYSSSKMTTTRRRRWSAAAFALLLNNVVVHAQQTLTDREILEKIYESTGGSTTWKNKQNWMQSTNICNWYGVVCHDETSSLQRPADTGNNDDDDDTTTGSNTNRNLAMDDDDTDDDGTTSQSGNIVALRLGANDMKGTLPAEVFDLPHLTELDVKDNFKLRVKLNGIPSDGSSKLQTLYLSNIDMTSVSGEDDMAGLAQATQLKVLHLTNCNLSGPLYEDIPKLSHLEELFVAFNKFEGPFPTSLYSTNLTQFWAYDNFFNGTIPNDIDTGLPNLTHLILGGNPLTGHIPDALTRLEHLRQLSIRNLRDTMELAGPGLSGPLPAFDTQSHIKILHLNHNALTGSIPSNLLSSFVGAQHRRLSVNLTHNLLTGTLPSEFTKFKYLDIDVTANQLTGFGDGLCDEENMTSNALMDDWMEGAVATYGCEAIMCFADAHSKFGRTTENEECFPCSLEGFAEYDTNLDDDDYYNDAGNAGEDGGRQFRQRQRRKLQDNGLDANGDGLIDVTKVYGKTQCEYLSEDGTTALDETGDKLLDLSINLYEYERTILTQLYNALGGDNWDYNDHWLDDSKGICVWYGITCDIVDNGDNSGDSGVSQIKLNGNNLVGTMPSTVYDLPVLKTLSLTRNDVLVTFENIENAAMLESLELEGVTLPTNDDGTPNLNNLERSDGLKTLILSDNNMKGSFPMNTLKNMTRLSTLLLDDNQLTGKLPDDGLATLKKMERFDVTRNNFKGPLPSKAIDAWNKLRILDLSDNLWTGTLPKTLNEMPNLEVLAIFGRGADDDSRPAEQADGSIVNAYNDYRPTGLTGPLLAFDSCPKLAGIYLEDNSLTGTISKNFLNGLSAKNHTIYISLSRNQLNGTLPGELSQFDKMSINLEENAITGIDDALCGQTQWMDGEVEQFGCDAILCPVGTYRNDIGRATSLLGDCLTCFELQDSNVLGHTKCGESALEKSILMNIYTQTDGPNWRNNKHWGDDTVGICEWYGVECIDESSNNDSGVIILNLEANDLQGTMPLSIYKLPLLQQIDVARNMRLKLLFDGIESAKKLVRLDISETPMVELTHLGDAPALQYLDAPNCGIKGPFPNELLSLGKQLVRVDLAFNDISGTIPTDIGKWTNITHLYLNDNQLKGTIPKELGSASSLRELDLAGNHLNGFLPDSLNNLEHLLMFSAKSQTDPETGKPSLTGPLISFSKATSLSEIYLDGNSLNGTFPENFLPSSTARTDQISAVYVGLKNNRIHGKLPKDLDDFAQLILDLGNNRISEIPSELCENKLWQDENVDRFQCDAILCPVGHYVENFGRQVNEEDPCVTCDIPGATPFMGSTTCVSQSEEVGRPILETLYHQCSGLNWNRRGNWTKPNVHVCDWEGIECDDETKTITGILLPSNNIVGPIPSELWSIPGVTKMWLYGNPDLTGGTSSLFQNIEDAIHLEELLLDSTNLPSIEGLGKATSLKRLDLRFNSLEGDFPYGELMTLTNLERLSLADNSFEGPLNSYALQELTKLTHLRVGGNKLNGPLPPMDMFPHLVQLDLSANEFTGTIPDIFLQGIDDYTKPMTIDLSRNKLQGTVPATPFEEFEDLTIYLRQNEFLAVDPELCTHTKWNDGDVGTYGCNGLLCPVTTFSEIGRQSSDDTFCQPCFLPTAVHAGSVECAYHSTSTNVMKSTSSATTMIMSTTLRFAMAFVAMVSFVSVALTLC